jgi:hypothetical protein
MITKMDILMVMILSLTLTGNPSTVSVIKTKIGTLMLVKPTLVLS